MLEDREKLEALAREAAAQKITYGALLKKLTPLQEEEIYRRAERQKKKAHKKAAAP